MYHHDTPAPFSEDATSLMWQAIVALDPAALHRALERDADPNARSNDDTPLTLAVTIEPEDFLAHYGVAALGREVERKRLRMVEDLLQHGARASIALRVALSVPEEDAQWLETPAQVGRLRVALKLLPYTDLKLYPAALDDLEAFRRRFTTHLEPHFSQLRDQIVARRKLERIGEKRAGLFLSRLMFDAFWRPEGPGFERARADFQAVLAVREPTGAR